MKILTDASGAWVMSKHELGQDIGAKWLGARASYVVSHEMGHALFAKAWLGVGVADAEAALLKGGATASASAAAEFAQLAKAELYLEGVANESFADAMAMAYMSKKLGREDFEALLKDVEHTRSGSFMSQINRFEVQRTQTKSGEKYLIDDKAATHMTFPALMAMRLFGYERLRAMNPQETAKAAILAAHQSILVTLFMGSEGLLEAFEGKVSKGALASMKAAGKKIWFDSHDYIRAMEFAKKKRALAKVLVDGVSGDADVAPEMVAHLQRMSKSLFVVFIAGGPK